MGMKNGIRKYEGAVLNIGFCAALPEKMRIDVREISNVECQMAHRGRGEATRLMEEVCREADASRTIFVLMPKPFGEHPPLDTTQLEHWYTKFGFHRLQDDPLILVRMFTNHTGAPK